MLKALAHFEALRRPWVPQQKALQACLSVGLQIPYASYHSYALQLQLMIEVCI